MRSYPDRYPSHPVFDARLRSRISGDEVGDLVSFGEPAIDLPHPHGASAAGRLVGIFVGQVKDAHVLVTPLWRSRVCVKRSLAPVAWRSEEHTSELQSRQYLVCR